MTIYGLRLAINDLLAQSTGEQLSFAALIALLKAVGTICCAPVEYEWSYGGETLVGIKSSREETDKMAFLDRPALGCD